ncbi:MAG TPA: hypothetical protein VKD70_16880 [Candidatus Acidoferrum sp.]|nr:hypothetical protein [Candidatus Acidoferrum sp.]
MADWKQITARIRRAKGSKDPVGQLSNLFQKTRDAMVAFELARYLETASKSEEAAKWYAISWQRFRRGDWKTKAQDALTRLGGVLPAAGEVLPVPEVPRAEMPASQPPAETAAPEFEASQSQSEPPLASESAPTETAPAPQAASSEAEKRGRRRGRRGGRNRRKSAVAGAGAPSSAHTHSSLVQPAPPPPHKEIAPPRVVDTRSIPRVPVEAPAESSGGVPTVKSRFGDPGLSSRLSLLEMQFRRLLTCTPAKLDQADRAPAGPGVFVLTDEEMSTYYYAEACDTLRIAIGNLARGGANRRSGVNIKPLLAEHLEIPEARVSKYLTEHCVVRWLQLDEGAEYFAHFVIAILRPVLNSQS